MSVTLLREFVALVVEKVRTKKGVDSKFGDRFDLKKFKELPSSEVMLQYASLFLDKLGKGSSRMAFTLSSKHALKIALNAKGIAQNETELDVFTNPKSKKVVAKIYGADDEFRWLISDLVKPVNNSDEFAELAGVRWPEFVNCMIDYVKHHDPMPDNIDEFVAAVVVTAKQNDLLIGDLVEVNHWGKTPDGRIVLLDYGFTHEVWSSHYSDSGTPQGKTAASDTPTMNRKSSADKTTGEPRTQKPVPKQTPLPDTDKEADKDARTARTRR
jgi:hypothetical protein